MSLTREKNETQQHEMKYTEHARKKNDLSSLKKMLLSDQE